MPGFIRKYPYISSTKKEGIIALAVYARNKTMLAEGFTFLGNNMTLFYGAPGMKFEVRLYSEVDETFKLVGMG